MNFWNLSYDYAALFFLFLIGIWYFNERKIPRRSHKTFLLLMIAIFFATVIKILATELITGLFYHETLYVILMSLQVFATNMIAIIFSIYLLLMVNFKFKGNWPIDLLYAVVLCANVLITGSNPIIHQAFRIDRNGMILGYGGYFMYVMDALLICICSVIAFRNKRRIQAIPLVPFIFNIVFSIIACVAQIFFNVPMLNTILVAVCLTLFHYQQNEGSVTDSVTGQFNRRFMGEYLRNRFLDEKQFGVIMVAMDDFKFINKTYGVESGDQLLFQVGQYLGQIPGSKEVFRLGSDQFCVVVDKNVDSIYDMAGQVMERFLHPWFDKSMSAIMMSASICCMECPKDAANYGELIEVMDYSMSVAKKTQKGRVTKVAEIDTDKLKQDKAIARAVRLAMDRDDLLVYYQPIFSVEKGVYNSAEALVRLHDEELGWISPEDFIPIAEKNGMITEMGEMILEKVCRFIRDFNLKETTVEYIEVNISPMQMVQPDFADRVRAILEKYQVSPSQINIEITETATLGAAAIVGKNMNALLDYGITFSLDDYGSGNANIDYINKMPFKIIKIDKYIIWDSFKNTKAGITLEYTIGMLNALQLHIVAEGVETEEMRQQLSDFGCHYMQGWLYSKAVPDTEFVELLEAQAC